MLRLALLLMLHGSFLVKTTAQSYKSFSILPRAYTFKLNTTQGFLSTQNEIDETNNLFYRSVESPKNAIEIFDLKTGNLKNTLLSKKFTINSFTLAKHGFWVYDGWNKKFLLIDRQARIHKMIKETDRENIDLVSIDGKFRPILRYKNELLSTGLFLFRKGLDIRSEDYTQSGVVRSINSANKTKYYGKIVPSAKTSYYGNGNIYNYTLNGHKLIVAPYFSDEIQVIDLQSNTTTFIKLNSRYANRIKPMAPIDDFSDFSNAQNNAYIAKIPGLIGMVHDKYRDVYYRFVIEPRSADPNKIKYSMYVLDKNFKILFYSDIPYGYAASNYFITSKGLHLLNKSKYETNNSLLTYDLFKLNKS